MLQGNEFSAESSGHVSAVSAGPCSGHDFDLETAAEAAQKLHQLVEFIPSRESHIRPLLERLGTDEERALVWRATIQEVGDPRKITAFRLSKRRVEQLLAAGAP